MTAVVALASVLAVLVSGRTPPRRRALTALARPRHTSQPSSSGSRSVARMVGAGTALIAAIALIDGVKGVGVGVVLAGIIAVAPARRTSPVIPPDDVAIVVDLVAGCLDAGAGLPEALDAAAMTATGLLRERCTAMAKSLRAGAIGREAWESWLGDPSLAGFARTAVRTSQTGAAAAADFRRTASRLRARHRSRAQQRVRQASVWLVVPLGLCFLPAFVLVAVVPIVLGLFPSLRL